MTQVVEGTLHGLEQSGRVGRFHQWWRRSAPRGEFWALVIATFLFNLGMSVFMFLYNLFMLDLGFREQSLGVLTSAMALGSMAGTIPMGILARRFGTKKVLIACLFLIAVAFGAKVCLLWYPAQAAFSFIDGVMLCGWVICLSPAVASVVEERKRPFAFSVLFAVAVGSCALGGFLGGHMPGWSQRLASHYASTVVSAVEGKRIALLVACAITALAAWPVTQLNDETRTQEVRWFHRPSPFLLRFLLASACWGAAIGKFNPFAGVFFTRYLGVQTAQLGSFFSIAQVVQAGAVLLVPPMLRRTGLIPGIMLAQLATAATRTTRRRTWSAAGGGNLLRFYGGATYERASHSEPAYGSCSCGRAKWRGCNEFFGAFRGAGARGSGGGVRIRTVWLSPCVGVGCGGTVVAAVIFRVLCGPRRSVALKSPVDSVA